MLMINIGVLAIQGSFIEHVNAFESLQENNQNVDLIVQQVRTSDDLKENIHGLVIPGGESTTIGHFLRKQGLLDHIKCWMKSKPKKYVWGTCAGLILLAEEIFNEKDGGQCKIGGLDIIVSRNSYGRQRESFEQKINIKSDEIISNNFIVKNNQSTSFDGIFIRAPKIIELKNPDLVMVLAENSNGEIVAVRQDNLMATTFHPELTNDLRFHNYFLELIVNTSR